MARLFGFITLCDGGMRDPDDQTADGAAPP
jgi:hypothetical protein